MAHVSLDTQLFFIPSSAASGKPACESRSPRNGGPSGPSLGGGKKLERGAHGKRLWSTAPSPPDVVLISSDSESDYGDLDDGFPPVDELLSSKCNVGPDCVAGTGKHYNPASASGHDAEEPLTAGIAKSNGQRSGPLMRAAVRDGSKESPLAHVGEPMRPTASSRLLQKPGAGYTAASSTSLPLPRPPSSPVPLQTDPYPTNGTENPAEARFALQNSDTTFDTRVSDTPGRSLNEDVADLHGPGSQRDPRPLTSSHGKISQPQENSARLNPADQADEWDKKYPFFIEAIRRRQDRRRADGLSEQRTCSPERSPAPPATAPPRGVSGSPRAVQQDEPVPQGRASCEAEPTSTPRDTASGTTVGMAPATGGACHISDATELCGGINSDDTSTIPESLPPSGAKRKAQDPSNSADIDSCEVRPASEDTPCSAAAEIANAVSSGTRREIVTVDVQRPPEGIESGQGGRDVEAMQAFNGKQGSPLSLRCQDPARGGSSNNKSQQCQVKVRRSLRKAAPRRRITDLTEDEDDDTAGTGGKNNLQPCLRRRRRCHGSIEAEDMYQPSEGSEKEQDNGGENTPMPPRKRHRTAAGRQIRSVGDTPGSRQVRTSHLTQEHSRRTIPSPPYSQGSESSSSESSDSETSQTTFQQWPLSDAVLKRVVINGKATFQVQFTWDPCVDFKHKPNAARGLPSSTLVKSHVPKGRRIGTRTAWTPQEERLIVELKEQGLKWNTIYQRFKEVFPKTSRRVENLQVQYCTKLKQRQ